MKNFCPFCDGLLVTNLPGQNDIDALCRACNFTFNIDACRVEFEDGSGSEVDPGYAEKMREFFKIRICPTCKGYRPGFGKCWDPKTGAFSKSGYRDQGYNGGEVNAVVCQDCDGLGYLPELPDFAWYKPWTWWRHK